MPRHSPPAYVRAHPAVEGPIPSAVSAEANPFLDPSPPTQTDTPAEARGRRILSTAFVRIGPDGQLTVELRGGRVLVLRGVTMGPSEYSGKLMTGGMLGKRYHGRYADVVAARPGGASTSATPGEAAAKSPARGD